MIVRFSDVSHIIRHMKEIPGNSAMNVEITLQFLLKGGQMRRLCLLFSRRQYQQAAAVLALIVDKCPMTAEVASLRSLYAAPDACPPTINTKGWIPMKKTLIALLLIAALLLLTACGNRALFDTTYTFTRAMIAMPDGSVIEGTVESWCDYEDGDQLQVTIGGVTYLTHASNVVLISE